ncbi:MAG: hypothetical protein CL694_04030 [Chloroflexi bacterium]|nr:hypothetical protein [Chloroflexota bacterium]
MNTPATSSRAVATIVRFIPVAIAILVLAAMGCGVKSGDRGSARPEGESTEFHRSPVTAFEQFRVDLATSDAGCTADPGDITVTMGQRVRIAIQLPTELAQGSTGSLEVVGEQEEVHYVISGLEINNAGGAFVATATSVDLEFESGARVFYDFNPGNSGAFDILCNDDKVGVFTVSPA